MQAIAVPVRATPEIESALESFARQPQRLRSSDRPHPPSFLTMKLSFSFTKPTQACVGRRQ
jgi:hypothetical protein